MIYLDYFANTPADPAVLEAFLQTERLFGGNPNSIHPAGQAARAEMDRVTAHIAGMLGVEPEEIIYTSGASESNNLALKGTVQVSRHVGKHIISTTLEHSSVGGALSALQQQGCEVDLADIGRDGKIDLEHLAELLRRDTVLVSVCAVDSELGTVQPIREIAALLKSYPSCRLHVDATQAVGKTELALAKYPAVRVNSPADAVPHILNLSVSGVMGTAFQKALAEQGVCVSVKSACSVEGKPSKAVYAVSRDRKNALSSWRISLSHLTTEAELAEFLRIFDRCYHELAD